MPVLFTSMKLLTRTPRPPLSEFVELLWFYQGCPQPHLKERALPTGTMELVVNLSHDQLRVFDRHESHSFRSFPGSMVCGAHSEFFVIEPNQDQSIVGVHFKPGGAFPFFNLPAGELHNTHLSLETLWGTKAGELRERLLEARTPDGQFIILEQFLLEQASGCLSRHAAVAVGLSAFQRVPHSRKIAEVVGQIGISQRRFIEVFRDQVGLTPKQFCRVRRFQSVLRLIGKGRRVDWIDIALACGYYDQAHFINDFQAFSGLNPAAYLRNPGERLNHVPFSD
jgi:AraC-like DNA-binding protein